mmetsp:Transcript_8802/g.19752  ORF Transcript_8802/g.19752 Transcript_8802/m.19752 type:complete len:404 (-) Transcript_8802:127-1338(-)|eukprot:CAMPEP_0172314228 /NCGR_PEP_ID=MMETSP1058-20130122/22014_1 /TAXON_ID=83371 /ORGANISM="Detonula confervacea, Strain CCMP 353" /LENGTH=403 /DNA_ID=CAMNT_0013028039 /DNA_START=84 /DNA_END=1295 /DNA_ORIENTATION=-
MVKIINSSAVPSNARNIIISGGGLAGLSTSLGLAKLGFHVDIIECRKEWLQQGSAFGLAANGRNALKELFPSPKSLDLLVEKGIYVKEHDSYLLVWYMVRDALLEEVKKCSSIDIHMGKTIERYDDTSDQSEIEVVVKDVENANEKKKLTGSLLIAADGVYSNIREMAGLEPAKFATKTKWRGTIPHVPKGSILEPFLDKGILPLLMDESTKGMQTGHTLINMFNFHPKIHRKMTFVLNASVTDLPPGTHPKELFRKYMPDLYHQQILEEVYNLADDRELRYPLAMAVIELPEDGSKGWGGRGRVLFVGDSAHAMRPASGLGGALAFEDAAVLCRLLKSSGSGSLETKLSAEALVREFEASRFDRVKMIWDNQWEISEGVYKNKSYASAGWSPDFAAWVKQGV